MSSCPIILGRYRLDSGNALEVLHAVAGSLAVASALCAADNPHFAAAHLRMVCDDKLKVWKSNNGQ